MIFRTSKGFSLIEIAIVLVIIALLASMALPLTAAYLNQQRRQATLARQAAIETAINLFVSQNQRLPCPADGQLSSSNAGYGKENGVPGTCDAGNQARGVVPFAAIGLSATEGTDGWGNFFTYRVDKVLTNAGAMNFTFCTPAGTQPATGIAPNLGCNSACSSANFATSCTAPTSVTAGRGLRVADAGGTNLLADPSASPSTGAAYVLISHGENQIGAYQPEGIYLSNGAQPSGDKEQNNYAIQPYVGGLNLIDAPISYGDGVGHFDDFVLRPSILAVATKAQLGPRSY